MNFLIRVLTWYPRYLYSLGYVNRRMSVGSFWGFMFMHGVLLMYVWAAAPTIVAEISTAVFAHAALLAMLQRLNDAGIQKVWAVTMVFPMVGAFILFWLSFSSSVDGRNEFGWRDWRKAPQGG